MKRLTIIAISISTLSLVSCSDVNITHEESLLLSSVKSSNNNHSNNYSSSKPVSASIDGGESDNFVKEDLKPWNPINTAKYKGRPSIKVCVRDHQCEDGDILQVFVDGKSFTKELTNAGYCRIMPVDTGSITVGVLAVNGSGNKGNCSYANANTGEISMHGINSNGSVRNTQVQRWSLRAKAGTKSTAKITVY